MNELNALDDLTALTDMGTELDYPATDGPPARLRYRVMNSFEAPAPRRRRVRVSLGWSLATSGGLAALVTVALVAGNTGSSSPTHSAGGSSPAHIAGSSAPPSAKPATVLTADDILTRAAQSLQNAPTSPPRADQLVYSQTIEDYAAYIMISNNPDKFKSYQALVMRQAWMSVDGTHDGLVKENKISGQPEAGYLLAPTPFPGCVNHRAAVVDKHNKVHRDQTQHCDVDPAYKAHLPTTPAGMLQYIHTTATRTNSHNLFGTIDDYLLGENYLTPAQLATVFRAASLIPDVTVVQNVVDLDGRHGVAVALADPRSHGAVRQELIFDPTTYAYRGYQELSVATGKVLEGEARLTNRVVDHVGQIS